MQVEYNMPMQTVYTIANYNCDVLIDGENSMRILLVEDQEDLARLTTNALTDAGFAVDPVTNLADAAEAAAVAKYDVFVLDRKLPDGDSIEWLRHRRREGITTPTLVLTATRNSIEDRVDGLYSGADDYLQKPVALDEIIARVRALLRRSSAISAPTTIKVGNLTLDSVTREIFINGTKFALHRRETALLEQLATNAGRVVPRQSIEDRLYGNEENVSANAIEVMMHRLRHTLTKAEANCQVHTIRGVGYMMDLMRAGAK